MRFAKISFLSLVLMAIGFVGNAEAQSQATDTLNLTGIVATTCSISVDADIDFGTFVLGSSDSGTTSITVACNDESYTVFSSTARVLDGPGEDIPFKLYRGTANTDPEVPISNATAWKPTGTVDVFAETSVVPAGQLAGTYSVALTITLEY